MVHVSRHRNVPPDSLMVSEIPSEAVPVSTMLRGWPRLSKVPYTTMFCAVIVDGPTIERRPRT